MCRRCHYVTKFSSLFQEQRSILQVSFDGKDITNIFGHECDMIHHASFIFAEDIPEVHYWQSGA
jgi:hypothetical protein